MLTCPMCKKSLAEPSRQCPRCSTDLSLLLDFTGHIRDGLGRADGLARTGQLGEAVWAYLEVLEVDPDNPTARDQVGRVVAAVRQFDRASPVRRWLRGEQRRRWLSRWATRTTLAGAVVAMLLLAGTFALGYYLGGQPNPGATTPH